jgi:hypothetical protein
MGIGFNVKSDEGVLKDCTEVKKEIHIRKFMNPKTLIELWKQLTNISKIFLLYNKNPAH